MTRLYAIDCNGVSHWLYHSKTARMDAAGNEITLGQAVRNWWTQFAVQMGPSYAAAIFDGGHNWRWQVHAEYKSTRKAKPRNEELIAALKTVPPVWGELGVPVHCYDTFEADDAIATIANELAGPETEVIIVSSDKDLLQLVGPHVRQYDPRPNKAGVCMYYDERGVEEKLGVPPHRVRDLLAIWGDSTDDVPGVEGWGRESAILAVRQTRSANEIFRRAAAGTLENITAARQKKLAEQRSAFDLSHKLVSLRFDVPVPDDLAAFEIKPQQAESAA